MEGLFLSLPPFSPDYSGVGASFLEMDAMIVIHDGTGCIGNYICHDEPRGERIGNMVFTTNLRELEVVMGDDEALLEKVERAAADLDPRMIVLINTPAPIVIGTDLKALARILERRTGKPTLFFDTNGIRMYDWGVEKAFLEAVKRFAAEDAPARESGGIAVLGAVPQDLGNPENAEVLRNIFEKVSGKKCTVIGMGSGERPLGAAAVSALNIAASAAAVPAAKWCEQEFGVPWIADLPVGLSGERRLGERIRNVLSGKSAEAERSKAECSKEECAEARCAKGEFGSKALVIHEQITANAVRECLKEEFGFEQVDVASFFCMRDEFCRQGDYFLSEELELAEKAAAGNYDVIFADRFMHDMLRKSRARLIDLPHLAVCEVMFCPMEFSAFGEKFSNYLKEQLYAVK